MEKIFIFGERTGNDSKASWNQSGLLRWTPREIRDGKGRCKRDTAPRIGPYRRRRFRKSGSVMGGLEGIVRDFLSSLYPKSRTDLMRRV